MADSSRNASLMATMPTPPAGTQQGLPRRVMLLSMISSETRKKACRSSVIQPEGGGMEVVHPPTAACLG